MASKAVQDAVKSRQEAGWTTAAVHYPNAGLKPPADFSPFVVVEFPIARADRLTIERTGLQRNEGTIRFVVHVRLGTGLDTALTYAGELADLFGNAKFDGVETWAASEPVPLGPDGGWYRVSTSIPYTTFT